MGGVKGRKGGFGNSYFLGSGSGITYTPHAQYKYNTHMAEEYGVWCFCAAAWDGQGGLDSNPRWIWIDQGTRDLLLGWVKVKTISDWLGNEAGTWMDGRP